MNSVATLINYGKRKKTMENQLNQVYCACGVLQLDATLHWNASVISEKKSKIISLVHLVDTLSTY